MSKLGRIILIIVVAVVIGILSVIYIVLPLISKHRAGNVILNSPKIILPPESIDARVVSVVQAWSGVPNPPVDTDQLAYLWGNRADPYVTIGEQHLVEQLQNEFSTPPITAKCVTVTSLSKISTVGALAQAVGGCTR